jgi:hypothetical protein
MGIKERNDNLATESVDDLEVTNQEAEDTKAGSEGGVDLSAFAGQTIRLRIASTKNQGTL